MVDINDGRYYTPITTLTNDVETINGIYTSILLAYILQYSSVGMNRIAGWMIVKPNYAELVTIVQNLGGKVAFDILLLDRDIIKNKFSITINNNMITELFYHLELIH